ncbi:MAG TPA: mechanosensitive ion channel domain-containing protein [Methylophilaceae bacterium]|nr:mechanosensitive ion channel domain-containing protein [Methylophilaceae bacterium]
MDKDTLQSFAALFTSNKILWQLVIVIGSLLLAWSVNGLLRTYVIRHAGERWKVGIEGINRILFPLTSLLLVYLGQLVLRSWQPTDILEIASTLLFAMAVIRLLVYALRYIFDPGTWVRTTENIIATLVWLVLALYLSGLLPGILEALDSIRFGIGKSPITLLLILQSVLTVFVTLIVVLWISRAIENKLMRAQQLHMNVRVVMTKLIRVVLSVLAVLIALSAIGFDITLLSVFGGALGVGLGFGLQKIASNYVSGFIILLDKSIHMGDIITVDSHYGIVNELRTRYMVLKKLDGTEVVIPNETLISNAVINHSFTDRKTQVKLPIQVSYDSPLELAMELMCKIASETPRVLSDPAPGVNIKGFGESGIDLCLGLWIADPEQGSSGLKSDIYLQIWRSFKQHSISIPYPQREIRILPEQSNPVSVDTKDI